MEGGRRSAGVSKLCPNVRWVIDGDKVSTGLLKQTPKER